ncbi:Mov34/MPN/PAD-1 family protein [Acetobacterium carbinolicum]|uniref:Mov34/MPN/PAD-1 family protein n=1 Tax=Acetobacterium carbinolicum TaxID=52690 RepID=UPI0039C91D00
MIKLIYVSENKEFCIEIDKNLLNDIICECKKASDDETGGILIGKYSEDRRKAIIKSISRAPKDSKSGKMSFKRGVKGLINLLDKKWDESGEYYLGEWHFHPNNSAQPSRVDVRQMKELAINKKLKCPEPILLVVGGNEMLGWNFSIHIIVQNMVIELYELS